MPTKYATKEQCRKYGDELREEVRKFFDDKEISIDNLINDEIAAGRDPTKYKPNPATEVNLYILKEMLGQREAQAMASAAERESVCVNSGVPTWVGSAQDVVDIAITIATISFSLFLTDLSASNVDIGEIYKGRPLGGENALIPKAREDVMTFLGLNEDQKKIIRDPVNEIIRRPAESVIDTIGGILKPIIPDLPNIPDPRKWFKLS